jgi:hypothetical protein
MARHMASSFFKHREYRSHKTLAPYGQGTLALLSLKVLAAAPIFDRDNSKLLTQQEISFHNEAHEGYEGFGKLIFRIS